MTMDPEKRLFRVLRMRSVLLSIFLMLLKFPATFADMDLSFPFINIRPFSVIAYAKI